MKIKKDNTQKSFSRPSIFNFRKFKNEGISLYFVVLILSVLMTVLLSLVNLSVNQLKITQSVGDSVVAFFASDSGIEHSLYNILKEGGGGDVSSNLGGASYNVSVTVGENTVIKSVGVFKNTKRAIEARY